MNSLQKQFFQTVKVVVLAAVIGLGVNYAMAAGWSAPSDTPPNNNTDAPVNVGTSGQAKLGGLTVGAGAGVANGLLVPNGKVGIGTLTPGSGLVAEVKVEVEDGFVAANGFCIGTPQTNCITAWPTGSGGTISGTQHRVPKFLQGGGVTESQIIDNGTNVGIGLSSPQSTLDINGTIRIRGGEPAAGKVLTSTNAGGTAEWRDGLTKSAERTCNAGEDTGSYNRVCDTNFATADWVACFLTTVDTSVTSGDNPLACKVYASGSTWKLEANGGSNDVTVCKAVCLR